MPYRPSFDALTYHSGEREPRWRRSKAKPAWEHQLGSFQRAVMNTVALATAARRATYVPSPLDAPDAIERWSAPTLVELAQRMPRTLDWVNHQGHIRRALAALVRRRRLVVYRAPRTLGGGRPLPGTADRYVIAALPDADLYRDPTKRRSPEPSSPDVPMHLPESSP